MKSTLLFWLVYLINACPLFSIDLPFLPEPYNSVHLMPYKPEGWYNNHGPISELVKRKNMRIVIEVGSWMGQSTLAIAKLLPENGLVCAVDTWEGSPNETHHAPKILATLYDQFLSNIIHEQLTHKIIPVRMDSLQAAKILTVQPDMIYME